MSVVYLMGRPEEAIPTEALDECSLPGPLEMRKKRRPEEAIPYLTEALELTKENGLVGSAVAEPTWNLARVYRALGDEEKEDIYLKAAVEGFRECYPPEHPKRIAAEQRMRERQGE